MLSKGLRTSSKRMMGMYNKPASAAFGSKVWDCAIDVSIFIFRPKI